MRRLKRSAERAAASSHGLVRFHASKRIPSWNCIARENSTGSLDEDVLVDIHQGGVGSTGSHPTRNSRIQRQEGSDSESESPDLNSWTRSGGPLMRTASADTFVDYVQSLDIDGKLSRVHQPNDCIAQLVGKDPTKDQNYRAAAPDRSLDVEFDQRDFPNRVVANSSSIMVAEGDLLQPERIPNGIVFNVVKKEVFIPTNRSHDSENNSPSYTSVAEECTQFDCPEKEIDISSDSDFDGNEADFVDG